jgi:hypothetical protein
MAERVWKCTECSRDPRCRSGKVRRTFAPQRHSRLRVLCHLLTFQRLTSAELRSAEYVDGAVTGVLLIRPHRQLAEWAEKSYHREDMHRVGERQSDTLRFHQPPRERPPG